MAVFGAVCVRVFGSTLALPMFRPTLSGPARLPIIPSFTNSLIRGLLSTPFLTLLLRLSAPLLLLPLPLFPALLPLPPPLLLLPCLHPFPLHPPLSFRRPGLRLFQPVIPCVSLSLCRVFSGR
jgi:hypothetical protein